MLPGGKRSKKAFSKTEKMAKTQKVSSEIFVGPVAVRKTLARFR